MRHCLVLVNSPTPGASLNLAEDAAPVTTGRDTSRDFPLVNPLQRTPAGAFLARFALPRH